MLPLHIGKVSNFVQKYFPFLEGSICQTWPSLYHNAHDFLCFYSSAILKSSFLLKEHSISNKSPNRRPTSTNCNKKNES